MYVCVCDCRNEGRGFNQKGWLVVFGNFTPALSPRHSPRRQRPHLPTPQWQVQPSAGRHVRPPLGLQLMFLLIG